MLPLIIESDDPTLTQAYLSSHHLITNTTTQIYANDHAINLESTKELLRQAKFHPGGQFTTFIIYDGHRLTPASQNALLKPLEESIEKHQFVIVTPNRHLLLPTIISRCQILKLTTTPTLTTNNLTKKLLEFTRSISTIIDSTDSLLAHNPRQFLHDLLTQLHQANHHLPTTKRLKIISLTLRCLADLDRNLNPRLAFDHFLLACQKAIQ